MNEIEDCLIEDANGVFHRGDRSISTLRRDGYRDRVSGAEDFAGRDDIDRELLRRVDHIDLGVAHAEGGFAEIYSSFDSFSNTRRYDSGGKEEAGNVVFRYRYFYDLGARGENFGPRLLDAVAFGCKQSL